VRAGVAPFFLALCSAIEPAMTLEERLALAREIAARTPTRIVIDTSRDLARQKSFRKAKKVSEILRGKRPASA
jgi:hypothetical protein